MSVQTKRRYLVQIRDSDERLLTEWVVHSDEGFAGGSIKAEIEWLERPFGDGRTNGEALAQDDNA